MQPDGKRRAPRNQQPVRILLLRQPANVQRQSGRVQPEFETHSPLFGRCGGCEARGVDAVRNSDDALARDPERERLLGGLARQSHAGVHASEEVGPGSGHWQLPQHAADALSGRARESQHRGSAEQLTEPGGERGVRAILMHVPYIEPPTVANQEPAQRQQGSQQVQAATGQAGQATYREPIDYLTGRLGAVPAFGNHCDD